MFDKQVCTCRELQAWQPHTEVLRVTNWLPTPQRFAVHIERNAPASVPEATSISTPSHIDVPPLGEKLCKLTITPRTPTPVRTTVTFTNEDTGEYIHFTLDYSVKEAGPAAEVPLRAPVRTRARGRVAVANPLPRELTVAGSCTDKRVAFPERLRVAPNSTQPADVSYLPLLTAAAQATLSYACTELGSQRFTLQLGGTAPGMAATLRYSVPLGRAETRIAQLRSLCPSATVYTVQLSADAVADGYSAPATLAAPAAPPSDTDEGVQVELPVTFQPTGVFSQRSHTLTVSSPEGGAFEIALLGAGTPPTPQGPIKVSAAGKGPAVPFTNPFRADAEFKLACDNPAFAVKATESLKAQAAGGFGVAFKEVPGRPRTAALTVTCPARTPHPWVFYLEA